MNATKAAAKLAEDLGIAIDDAEGTGKDGRLVVKDVELLAAAFEAGMPDDLDARGKRIWRDVEEYLRAKSLWEPVHCELLERYIRALQRAVEARAIEKVDGSTTKGSQDQLVVHPTVKIARDNEHDALDLAKELLITPAAQRRHEGEGEPPPDGPDNVDDGDDKLLGF